MHLRETAPRRDEGGESDEILTTATCHEAAELRCEIVYTQERLSPVGNEASRQFMVARGFTAERIAKIGRIATTLKEEAIGVLTLRP